MHILFLPGNMGVTARNRTVKFGAVVNGEIVPCEISEKALKVHFGAKSGLQEHLFHALEEGRERIQAVIRTRLAGTMATPPCIDSADFDK
jgi:hypothetical protein